jgi:hypothetical protein
MALSDTLRSIRDTFARLRVIESRDIKPIRTAAGTELLIKEPGSGGGGGSSTPEVVQAVVGGGSVLTGFSMIYFANGWNQASTGGGTGYPADLAIGDVITDGEQVMAFLTTATITGDSE